MIDRTYEIHTGKELTMMLEGKKPMAMFYRIEEEDFDELDGQNFEKYVTEGQIKKFQFSLKYKHKNGRPDSNLLYWVYTLPEEEWRFPVLQKLKTEGEKLWNRDMEIIEGTLLGYTLEENIEHITKMYEK